MLKIAHFIDSLRFGGKERQIVELIKGLQEREIIQHVIIMDEENFYLQDINNRKGISIRWIIRKMRWDPIIFLRLLQFIIKEKPDIIHTNSMMTSFYTLPIAFFTHTAFVNGSIRNAFKRKKIKWQVERTLLKLSKYIIANSMAGLNSRKIKKNRNRIVIHNGFNLKRIEGIEKKKKNKNKIVGMVAEFSDYKDYLTFINAAIMILKTHKNIYFMCVGEGKNLNKIKKLSVDYRKNILFLGKRKHIEKLMRVFDIGVLSTYEEGISNSIMEYMSLEIPVISTDCKGTREIIIDGETGFLVPVKNSQILCKQITYLLQNYNYSKLMGKKGAIHLRRNFSYQRMINEYFRFFYEIKYGKQ